MSFKKLVLLWLVAGLPCAMSWGQTGEADSLKALLGTLPADTAKVNVLLNLAQALHGAGDPAGLGRAGEALQLARRLGFKAGVARAHLALGRFRARAHGFEAALAHYDSARQQFEALGNPAGVALAQRQAGIALLQNARYEAALGAFRQALAFYQRTGNREQTANCLLNLGLCQEHLGRFSAALAYFFQGLRIDEALGDTNNVASDYDQIAIIYKKQGSYGQAETFARKAVALYEQTGNHAGLASALVNLGILYKTTKAYEKALAAYVRAGELFERAGNARGQAATLSNRGELYAQQGRHALAIDHFERSLALSRTIGWKEAILSNLEGLANVYAAQGKTGLVLEQARGGMALAEQIRSPEYTYKFNKLLAAAYKAGGQYAKALEHLEKSVQDHDSLYSLEKSRQIEELQVKYETEKKERQIALLQKDRALQAAELSRKTFWQYGLAFAIGVLGVVGLLLFRTYRVRQQGKRDLLREQLKVQQLEANQLAEVNALKSRFFSNIAHEFRTPLTLMLGPVENLLADSRAGSREHGLLRMAQTHATRLLALINQLLDLSRLEAGVVKPDLRQGDAVAFLKGTTYAFLSLAEQKDIRLAFATDVASLVMDYDPDKLEKVMNNLLSNAFKFTPAAGEVRVELTHTGGATPHLHVSVRDTGPGLPPDQLARVFERFYQAPNQPGGVTAGSGIGLALTKELVEMHGGTLRVESPPGQGATFTFAVPVTRQAPPADAPLAEPNAVPARLPEAALLADADAANPERPDAAPEAPLVLVIEDNPDVRRFIRQSLEGDYQVAEACNGAEGVEKATELVPDLVISDVMMPGMDGYQACRALKAREETSHIPVILLTAKAGLESKLEGLDTGADDYLAKPFHTAELKGRIRNLIQLRKRLQLKYMAQTITEQPQAPLPAPENAFLARLRAVVEANFRDEEFSIEQLSREIGMSRTQVHRKLKALTNQSASQFIRTLRLQKARALLLTGRHNVSEAAYLTGFNSPAYFSTCFTELYGYPPSELKVKDGQA